MSAIVSLIGRPSSASVSAVVFVFWPSVIATASDHRHIGRHLATFIVWEFFFSPFVILYRPSSGHPHRLGCRCRPSLVILAVFITGTRIIFVAISVAVNRRMGLWTRAVLPRGLDAGTTRLLPADLRAPFSTVAEGILGGGWRAQEGFGPHR